MAAKSIQLRVIDLLTDKADLKARVSRQVFDRPENPGLVHQVVTSFFANGRQGTRANKSRSEVQASGRKPWRQKGTGRARVGTAASPIWRGGGVNFSLSSGVARHKVNRQSFRVALCTILSMLHKAKRVEVVNEWGISEPKTRLLNAQLKKNDWHNLLIVLAEPDHNLELAARNLPGITVQLADRLSPLNLLNHQRVVFTKDALKKTEEWLQ